MTLTREAILNMEVGRELDVLVAERVMKWHVNPKEAQFDGTLDYEVSYESDDVPESCPYGLEHVTGTLYVHRLPYFSTDIAAAWGVVERTQEQGFYWLLETNPDRVAAKCAHPDVWILDEVRWISGDSLPEIICRAALLAAMGEPS